MPVAGAALAIALALVVLRSCLAAPARSGSDGSVNGTRGMEFSLLFDGTDGRPFAASVLRSPRLAPTDVSGLPAISGTRRPAMGALRELASAIATIEGEGYEVGLSLLDLNTGIRVTYNPDLAFYSASSIKGPNVTALAEYELDDTPQQESRRISSVIEYSDNNAYAALRTAYGNDAFARLVDESGAMQLPSTAATDAIGNEAGELATTDISDNFYEFYTPNQLLTLWERCYAYLSSGSEGAAWLASEFEAPETSAIRVTAGSLGTTWSKAGWYPGDLSAFGTTVDAGVVRTDTGDFLVCVMTTAPEDFTALESVLSPLIALRATLTS